MTAELSVNTHTHTQHLSRLTTAHIDICIYQGDVMIYLLAGQLAIRMHIAYQITL